MTTRTVVLHYHLFKNAGTSVDHMLKAHFGPAWVTAEFAMAGNDNTKAVQDWIADNPEAQAFSSHTMVGPLPQVEDVDIIPVIMLRNPLARIASAYRFERKQEADTWGAELAKKHDFEGYVQTRLARAGDRQCRNFQVSRLATLCPGPDSEFERAKAGLKLLHKRGVIGRIEHFNAFTEAFIARLTPAFPDFAPAPAKANTTSSKGGKKTPFQLATQLTEANAEDIALLVRANALLGLPPGLT